MTYAEQQNKTIAQLLAEDAIDAQLLAARIKDDRKRRAYLTELIEAVDGDLDATWQAAHERLTGEGVAA